MRAQYVKRLIVGPASFHHSCIVTSTNRKAATLLAIALCAGAASARDRMATTRLVRCGAESCLLVRGHRSAPSDAVRINGQSVGADGGTSWRVRLPVATVRDWSAPAARTIHVAVADDARSDETVALPIGLLGGRIELASLVVRAR